MGGVRGVGASPAYDCEVAIALNTDLKPKPGWDERQDPQARRHVEASGATYEAAYEALMAQVPEGWLVVGVKRW